MFFQIQEEHAVMLRETFYNAVAQPVNLEIGASRRSFRDASKT
jgi:hypothetical protein